MRAVRPIAILLSVCALIATVRADTARTDLPQRQELNRAALAVSLDMEVITSVSEIRKGESIPRHSHHGVETGYVLQGSMVQLPGRAPTLMQTGSSFINARDVPHGGFTVVGDEPLRLLTVHVVDRSKPLYEWTK